MAAIEKQTTIIRSRAIVRRNRRNAYCFLLPNFVGFFIFTLFPALAAFILSFMKWDSSGLPKFVGMNNFKLMIGDSTFIISFLNTLYYTFTSVPLMIVFSLLIAVILNMKLKGVYFIRAIHFFPNIASIIAVAVVWQFLYQPDMGPINQLLKLIGIEQPPRWLSSTAWAMPGVVIMRVWQITGYYMIMFMAGLQSIPVQLYEAAVIDGANSWKKFWHITLPMLSPTMFFVVVMGLINSFKVFDQVYIMTSGGPGRATSVMVYQIYTEAFVNFNFGYASAISFVLFSMILIVTIIQFRMQEKWVNFVN